LRVGSGSYITAGNAGGGLAEKTKGKEMPSKSKTKGNAFERELVNQARKAGLTAVRAWGSNGEALGESPEVDCKIDGMRIQAKRRKKLPAYLDINDGVDAVAFRRDRGETLVLIKYANLLEMLVNGGW